MPTPVLVEFTDDELAELTDFGRQRRQYARSIGATSYYGRENEDDERVGILGERAAARVVDSEWSPTIGILSAPDMKAEVETRARRVPGEGLDLPLMQHDKRKINWPFVLTHVIEEGHKVWVMGWIIGRDGMKRRYWRDLARYKPHGICFVPPGDLLDISLLRARLHPNEVAARPSQRPARAAYYANPGDATWRAAWEEAKALGKV